MLGKLTRRLIKEALIVLIREDEKYLRFPVYYLPIGDKSCEEIGEAASSLHDLPVIPWPDDNCIICTEDPISSMVATEDSPFILRIILHEKENNRYNTIPKAAHIEQAEIINYFEVILHNRNRIIVSPLTELIMTNISKVKLGIKFMDGESDIDKAIDFIKEKLRSISAPVDMSPENIEKYKSYLRATVPRGDSFWHAVIKMEKDHRLSGIGLASDFFAALSNIAFPCHYVLESYFRKGFGSPRIKKITRGKPIFSVITYDRIYKEFKGHPGNPVAPHFRRGHIRHHWLKAVPPIDRLSLPADAFIRRRIAIEKRVPRSYIPPTWIGQNEFIEEDVVHRIVTEEIPLQWM